jgi:hypothetical protein
MVSTMAIISLSGLPSYVFQRKGVKRIYPPGGLTGACRDDLSRRSFNEDGRVAAKLAKAKTEAWAKAGGE